jgi:competence ComEA-like helix-hairpin-helix protein
MAKVTQERIQSFAFVISIMMCAALAGGFLLRGVAVQGRPRQIQLDDRINPNNAPAVSLMRLQGVGLSRAEAIVACRENFGEKERNNPAFRDANDLRQVRGIGPKTVEGLGEWLRFD